MYLQENVALVRDVLFLLLALVFMLTAFGLYRKVSKTAKAAGQFTESLKRTAKLVSDTAASTSSDTAPSRGRIHRLFKSQS